MGGAAGHMRHPYDLQQVQSGTDLISIFEQLKSYVSQHKTLMLRLTVLMFHLNLSTESLL